MSIHARRNQRSAGGQSNTPVAPEITLGTVSATVGGSSVTLSGSITTTQPITFDGLNISIAKSEPPHEWVASVAAMNGTTIDGTVQLSGTRTDLPNGDYIAYISYSRDSMSTWTTGPRVQFTVYVPPLPSVFTLSPIRVSLFEKNMILQGTAGVTQADAAKFTVRMMVAADAASMDTPLGANIGRMDASPFTQNSKVYPYGSTAIPAGRSSVVVFYEYSTDEGATWQRTAPETVSLATANIQKTPAMTAFTCGIYSFMWAGWPTRLRALSQDFNTVTLVFAHVPSFSLATKEITLPIMDSPSVLRSVAEALDVLRARGVRIHIGLGGEGSMPVNLSQTSTLVGGFKKIVSALGPIHGLELIIQTQPLPTLSQHASLAQALKTEYGANFAFSLVSTGPNIEDTYGIARDLDNQGLLNQVAQTYYEAPVDWTALKNRLEKTNATYGIPYSKMSINMMTPNMGTGPAANYWTVAQCSSMMSAAYTNYGVQRANLYEIQDPQAADWANRMWVATGRR